jgi:hypothetical protein
LVDELGAFDVVEPPVVAAYAAPAPALSARTVATSASFLVNAIRTSFGRHGD